MLSYIGLEKQFSDETLRYDFVHNQTETMGASAAPLKRGDVLACTRSICFSKEIGIYIVKKCGSPVCLLCRLDNVMKQTWLISLLLLLLLLLFLLTDMQITGKKLLKITGNVR